MSGDEVGDLVIRLSRNSKTALPSADDETIEGPVSLDPGASVTPSLFNEEIELAWPPLVWYSDSFAEIQTLSVGEVFNRSRVCLSRM
jgi:hypothetical protein